MEKLTLLLPLSLGIILVIQTGLNDIIQDKVGLLHSLFFNNIAFITITLCLLIINYYQSNLLPNFLSSNKSCNFIWWFLTPGVLAAVYLGGSIISFNQLGASTTVILLVASQIVTSVLWDYFKKGSPIDLTKIFGASAIILGTYLVAKD